MEKNKYKELVNHHTTKENRLLNAFIAFFVGGSIGLVGQFLVEFYSYILEIPTKDAGVFMIITLIFIGCLLTCFGFFDKWVTWARCGLIIPITGFAHSMQSAALDYRKEGFVTGLGANMLKLAGTVIIYGVISAYIFGIIRFLLFGGTI